MYILASLPHPSPTLPPYYYHVVQYVCKVPLSDCIIVSRRQGLACEATLGLVMHWTVDTTAQGLTCGHSFTDHHPVAAILSEYAAYQPTYVNGYSIGMVKMK